MSTRFKKISTLWRARNLLANPTKLIAVFKDSRTPFIARALPIVAIAYVLFPIDIIPDFIPILGQIDDITIVVYLLSMALNHVPEEVFRKAGVEFQKVTDI